jgi:RND family efflux transporter MFP subunit
MMRKILRVLLPLLVLVAGVAGARHLIKTRPQAKRAAPPEVVALVSAQPVTSSTQKIEISAMGTVVPAQTLALLPQVAGRVIELHPALVQGGRVREGEVLVRLDDSDYRAAVEQAKANIARVDLEMAVERGRARVARGEWKRIGKSVTHSKEGRDLALRRPQLRNLKASRSSAEAALKQARRNVERTVVRAPMNAIVQAENVEVGALIGPQAMLATLVGTDAFQVQVSVPVESLRWIAVPGLNAPEGAGGDALITQELSAGTVVTRKGRVLRALADLDPVGRMARLLVEVPDPLGLETATEGAAPDGKLKAGLPLLLGSYVQVDIEGTPIEGAVKVARAHLHDGNTRSAGAAPRTCWSPPACATATCWSRAGSPPRSRA